MTTQAHQTAGSQKYPVRAHAWPPEPARWAQTASGRTWKPSRIAAVRSRSSGHTKSLPPGNTDLRLCKFFGLSNGYWLRAQAAYDIEVAEDALSDTLTKIKPWSGLDATLGHTG